MITARSVIHSMARFYPASGAKRGQPPGTLAVHPAAPGAPPVRVQLFGFGPEDLREEPSVAFDEAAAAVGEAPVTWINIDGVHDADLLRRAGERFGLHPLTIEDIAHVGQRPRYEDTDGYLFVVLHMLRYETDTGLVTAEQISLVVGRGFVLSFQEREGDVFGVIRDRLRLDKGRGRRGGADYLAYALMDAIVDQYFTVLERLGESLANLEEEVVTRPAPAALQELHRLKRELIFLRKSVWPLRECIGGLHRSDSPLLERATSVYLRDLYDHTMHVIDTVETFRDMVSGMLDIYLSSVSNRMNEVMKLLTVIATIFIPLTFLAGVYGMNFDHMPELHWRWGYFGTLGVMLAIGLGMLAWFRRRHWL